MRQKKIRDKMGETWEKRQQCNEWIREEKEPNAQRGRAGQREAKRWREQVFSLSRCHFTDPRIKDKDWGETKKEDVHYQTTLSTSMHLTHPYSHLSFFCL